MGSRDRSGDSQTLFGGGRGGGAPSGAGSGIRGAPIAGEGSAGQRDSQRWRGSKLGPTGGSKPRSLPPIITPTLCCHCSGGSSTPPPPGSCSPLLPAAHSGLAWLYPLQPPPLTQTHARPPFPSLCPFLPLFGAVLAAGFVWASSQRRFSQLRRPPRTRVCTRQESSIAHACAPARCAAAKAHLGTALCTPAAALWHGCISPPPPPHFYTPAFTRSRVPFVCR